MKRVLIYLCLIVGGAAITFWLEPSLRAILGSVAANLFNAGLFELITQGLHGSSDRPPRSLDTEANRGESKNEGELPTSAGVPRVNVSIGFVLVTSGFLGIGTSFVLVSLHLVPGLVALGICLPSMMMVGGGVIIFVEWWLGE